MVRNSDLTEKLRVLLAQLTALTAGGFLRWERQLHSAHRYAKWNDHLLILGPANPLIDYQTPRYLFITPFSSPTHLEIASEDAELREPPMALVSAVEAATINQEPTDLFSLTQEALSKLSG